MTIREALIEANKSINTLDSKLLLLHSITLSAPSAFPRLCASKFSTTALLSMSEEQIDDKIVKDFYSLVERRKNGECAAYITGKKEFWGLEFLVNKNVLVPRPETEILVEKTLEMLRGLHGLAQIKKEKTRILDLCTGSGAIAIALKHEMPELEVYATDISPEALETAKKNAKRLLPNKNKITFLQGDLYNALIPHYSLIVSNPPYVATNEIQTLQKEVQNEPRVALDGGANGLEIIKRIITDAPNYLQKGGALLLEADPRQMETIKKTLASKGFIDIQLYKDMSGLNRVIGGYYFDK